MCGESLDVSEFVVVGSVAVEELKSVVDEVVRFVIFEVVIS